MKTQNSLAPTAHVAILQAVRDRLRLDPPTAFQHDELRTAGVVIDESDCSSVSFVYDFDQDCASQYDKTLRIEGLVHLDRDGTATLVSAVLVHLGVAAMFEMPEDVPTGPPAPKPSPP